MKNKTTECLVNLSKYFDNFETKDVANVYIPEEINVNTEEWILYIFYSCLLDYGMKSKIYHQNLANTYHNYSDIFNPKIVVEKYEDNQNELLNILKENVHPRFPNVALKKWLKLADMLCSFDGVLAKIQSMNDMNELNNFIYGTRCYGQKTGGLLIRLITESEVWNKSDELLAIPLDRHDIEISYLVGIVDKKELNKKEIEELSTEWIRAGKELNISPCNVDKYLWEVGNSFCNKKKCFECPLKNNCKKK